METAGQILVALIASGTVTTIVTNQRAMRRLSREVRELRHEQARLAVHVGLKTRGIAR